MGQLPVYIQIIFILSTLLTVLLLYKSAHYSRSVIIMLFVWLALQSVISLSGFYTVTNGLPPRFVLLLLPPIILISSLFFTKKGMRFINSLDVKTLTLLHTVRILVELTLYGLYLHKAAPKIMTFEGSNFDILCGLTAPFVYYFGYIKNILSRRVLITWNIICLLLLANIVVIAILSAPLSFQQFAFDDPNIAVLYFPFVWLPCCIVPIVLLAHLAAINNLLRLHKS